MDTFSGANIWAYQNNRSSTEIYRAVPNTNEKKRLAAFIKKLEVVGLGREMEMDLRLELQ